MCRTQILFWHRMWITLCEEKERTLEGAVLSLIFCYKDGLSVKTDSLFCP